MKHHLLHQQLPLDNRSLVALQRADPVDCDAFIALAINEERHEADTSIIDFFRKLLSLQTASIGCILATFIFAMMPALNHAEDRWDYSTPDYYYNSPYYSGHMGGGYRTPDGYTRFTIGLDDIDYISSGISSYQGTSTGPGPNGGYPGAPRGIYQTHYVDTSIYPNSYMRFQSR